MKGKIIKIDDNKIVIRPCENFLDITIKIGNYNPTELIEGKEVNIKIDKFVVVVIDGFRFYGTLNYEDK